MAWPEKGSTEAFGSRVVGEVQERLAFNEVPDFSGVELVPPAVLPGY